MDDISDVASVATSTPDEAARNISSANLTGIDPTYVGQHASDFSDIVDKTLVPQFAETPVSDYMHQSTEHAALAKPDVDHLNWMSRQAKMIGDYVFDRPTTNRQIVDLNLKKMNQGGELNDEDKFNLMSANEDAKNQANTNYDLDGPLNQIPAIIAGGISDIGQSVVRSARNALFDKNIPKTPFGIAAGTAYGTMVKDPFDTLSAGTYNELSRITDENGQPKNLDHDTKLAYARGVGIVGTAAMNLAGYGIAEASPFLKPLVNPVIASGLINSPTKAAILIGLGNAMKGSAAVAGASGLTEVAKIVAEEMGKNNGTSDAGIWNSLQMAMTKANAGRVGEAAAGGALMGAAIEAPLQIAGFGRTKQFYSDAFQREAYARAQAGEPSGPRNVTPNEPVQLQAGTPAPKDVSSNEPIDLTPSGGDRFEQSIKTLQLNEALHNINDVQKSTNINDVAPSELNEVNERNFEAAGMGKVYVTPASLDYFANSEDKKAVVQRLVGNLEGNNNEPISVDTADVMKVAKQYPDILDHVQYSPDTPSGMSAKEHVEALNSAEEQRQKLMTDLGIKPQEVQPENNVKNLVTKTPVEKVPYDISTDVKRTQEILDEKKSLEPEEGVTRLPSEQSKYDKKIAKLDTELAEIKDRVTGTMKDNPSGSVLHFPYDQAKAAERAELEYGRAPTFTEAIQKVLPPEAVAKYNEAQLRARLNVSDLVHDAAVHEMNQVVDQTTAMAKEDARRGELERIIRDPNYHVVDQFHSHQIANSKGQKKRSIYAIDPTTLTDDLLHYVDNPQIKAHKVFAKGANNVEDSAQALGFASGKDLLEVLSKTPTREQIIKARAKFYDSDIEKLAKAGVDLDHTNIMKAFKNHTLLHIEEMKFLKDQEWSDVKFGIKKIALPLPRMEDIEHDAREAVKQMKVGDLKGAISQHVIGERTSQKIAIHAILNNEVETAFEAKEAAARNSAMQGEIRKAIAEINRAQKFFRRLEDPTAVEIMRAAGKVSQDALNEITDVFNFNPKMKGQSEQNSYNKWVRKELEQGRGDFSIPDRLTDVRKSINEMTPEQVGVAFDRAKTVVNEAKFKAELIENKNVRDEERSVDRITEQILKAAETFHGSSKDNVPPVQNTKSKFQALRLMTQGIPTLFTNMEHTLRYYDNEVIAGFFQKTFLQPLKGDGQFYDKSGSTKVSRMQIKMATEARSIMDNHGSYDKVEKTILTIPEFKDFKDLNYGKLTKGDLMTAWAFKGDPGGRARLQSNFRDSNGKGLMLETWQKVFDRELTKADVTSMQYAIDMNKSYQEETRDLQNRTKGEDVKFIKGVSNEHQGVFYPGGYVRLKYKNEWSTESAKKLHELLENKKAAYFGPKDGANFGRQYAAETTEQGRLIERSGNERPLDLSLLNFWRSHEEIIHDLSYREPVMNALKLLKDKRISSAMITMGGQARYDLVVNTVKEIAGRAQRETEDYFSDQNNLIKSLMGKLQSNFNVAVLGPFTVPIQYHELIQLAQNMGPGGGKHLLATIGNITTRPHHWGIYRDYAAELDPTIANAQARVQNKITSTIFDIIPKQGEGPVKAATKWMTDKWLAPIGFADVHDKVIAANAGARQFLAGDVKDWPIEKVLALSEEDRMKEMQAYIASLSRLSLMHGAPEDQAPWQKLTAVKPATYFWNFFRNVLNNQVSLAQKAVKNLSNINKGIGQGGGGFGGGGNDAGFGVGSEPGEGGAGENFKSGVSEFGSTAGILAYSMLLLAVGRMGVSILRGQDNPLKWDYDFKSKDGIEDAGKRIGEYLLESPIDQMLEATPIVKDMKHAIEVPDKVIRGYVDRIKDVRFPVISQLSDLATATHLTIENYKEADKLSNFLWIMTHMNDKETKAMMNAGAVFEPFPVNTYAKLMKWVNLPLNSPMQIGTASFEKLKDTIAEFKANQADPDKKIDVSPHFTAQLDRIQLNVAPKTVTIPDGMTDTMKYAMSGANWSAPNGIYGFTKEQWNQVKESAPDLGLTDGGRISKNTEQQEKAMDWYLHDAAQTLAADNIRVDKMSLYSSFKFSPFKYEALYNAPADAKVKSVLSADDIAKNPDIQQFKTVGQLKLYLNNQVNKAASHANGSTAQLTKPTNKPEDNL